MALQRRVMALQRRMMAGTGWKMNHGLAEARAYADELKTALGPDEQPIDLFVLPPFTALAATAERLGDTRVAIGAQNMHWEPQGAWTGEISAPMLLETGCRYVELAHSERLAHFGETYALVRRKLDLALASGLTPILCLGELEPEKAAGRADEVVAGQVMTALAGTRAATVHQVVLAYEPRWAIGGAAAAPADYVAERHARLRGLLEREFGADAAQKTRILYGGSVSMANAGELVGIPDVDGLFVGRAAWSAAGFLQISAVVAAQSARRQDAGL